MKKESVNQDNKDYEEKINFNFSLTIISLLLFFFFFLPYFHNWANSLFMNLHFCDHILCIFYSIIWLFFGAYNFINFYKEKKKFGNKKNETKQEKKNYLKKWLIIFLIVLIIGIILMNVIPCDSQGNIDLDLNLGIFSNDNNGDGESLKTIPCEKTNWPECNGYCEGGGECLPIRKADEGPGMCRCEFWGIILNDTDGGLNPAVRGELIEINSLSGESETYKNDTCINYFTLREYSLLDGDYSYNITLVNCRDFYDDVFACCKSGACLPNCSSYDCSEFALENGFSNWQGGISILGECEEIAVDDCGAKPGSLIYDDGTFCCVWDCKEIIKKCEDSYPSCGGSCPPDNECVSYAGECLCVPGDFQFCEDSYPSCNGYCESGTCISDDIGGCYCEKNVQCEDSFNLGCSGYCGEGLICQENKIEGCECVKEAPLCFDSDEGINATIPGTCNDGNSYTDYCLNDYTLMEWYCGEYICVETPWQCDKECIETPEGSKCE